MQVANHAISCFRGHAAVVGRPTGPVITAKIFAASQNGSRSAELIQYAPSLATTALRVLAMSRKSLAIDQLST